MPSRIKCPKCEASFAYSPALLGKTIRCRSCQHTFTITAPPPEDSAPAPSQPGPARPAPAAPTSPKPAASAPGPAPASKSGPPPLPPAAKGSKSGETRRPASTKGSKSGETRSPVADKGSKPGVARRKGRDDEDEDDDRPPVGDDDRDDEDEDEDDRPSRRKGERSRYAPAPEHESNPMLLIGLIAAFVVGFIIIACGIGYLMWPSPTPPASQVNPDRPVSPMAAADPPRNLEEIIAPAPERPPEVAGPPPERPNFELPKFDPPDAGVGPRPGPPPGKARRPAARPPGGPADNGKPKPLLAGPKFAPVEPLPIEPATLAGPSPGPRSTT